MTDDIRARIVSGVEEALNAPPDPEFVAEMERVQAEAKAAQKELAERPFRQLAEAGAKMKADAEKASAEREAAIEAAWNARVKKERRDARRPWLTAGLGAAVAIGLGLWNRFDPPAAPATEPAPVAQQAGQQP